MTTSLVTGTGNLRRTIHFQAGAPDAIWADIASRQADIAAANRLAAAVMGDIGRDRLWTAAWRIATKSAYALALKRLGRYVGESDYLAGLLGGGAVSCADMAGLQRLYTLTHAGCSAVMGWDKATRRMVHFRCLDWPSAGAIAEASRLYEAVGRDGALTYRSAGILGLVGCLTATKPGFSAAINFAPWNGPSLSPRPDPTFLLRQLMESAAGSYDEARKAVESWRPSAPVFITLCGTRRSEACIIAFGSAWSRPRGPHVTEIGNRPWLVQTNHFDPCGPFAAQNRRAAPKVAANWDDCTLMQTSMTRLAMIESALQQGTALRDIFSEQPVWNHQTAQWVAMTPATGEMRLEVRA